MKALDPIKHRPIWDEFDTWDWQRQSEWSLANPASASLRKAYIAEQLELAKERRLADAFAEALDTRLRQLVKDIFEELSHGALQR